MTHPLPRHMGVFTAALLAAGGLAAAGANLSSPAHPPRLLEVYTSEGCSSCPAADLWLGELRKEPDLWTSFIPITWHVDYWDSLGWKDSLATRRASVRQHLEAEAGKVYTPGFFLNAAEWRGFFKGEPLPPSDAPEPGPLTVTEISRLQFVVKFVPSGIEKGPLNINATLLGMDIEADVTGGENQGKHLHHDFVGLGLRTVPMTYANGEFSATVALTNGTPVKPENLAAAFWITRPDSFQPLQAVAGPLSEPDDEP